jgi:hypothetical protein
MRETTLTPDQDMAARWRPSETAVAYAVALLKAEPFADYALVPMILPGKTHGWWEIGQEVQTVPGVVLLAVNNRSSEPLPYNTPVPTYSWARHECWELARRYLADSKGTTAYAAISADGTWAVFED